ncbi:putative G-protein coupled receptor 34 [Pogona vitticeps]
MMKALNLLNISFMEENKQNVTGKILSDMPNTTECAMAEESLSLALLFSYSIIFVIGLLGNVTALYAFLCIHCKKNSIQIYLFNVAIADLLLIFCLPFRIVYHVMQNKWVLGLTFCKIIGNLFYMNMYLSIVLLGLISLDRYIKINRSIQRPKVLTTKQSIHICCTLWIVAIVGFIVMVVQSNRKEDKNSAMCFHYREKQNAKTEAGLNYILVIIFWIVFILLILSYIKTGNNLLKMSKRRKSFPNNGKYIAIARNSFIVLIIFTLCFVPYHIFRFIYITSQLQNTSCHWKEIIHKCNEIMLVFSSFNSCLDPVMYFLMSRGIRKTVLQLICKRLHLDSTINENTSEIKQGYSLQDNLENSTHLSRVYLRNVK